MMPPIPEIEQEGGTPVLDFVPIPHGESPVTWMQLLLGAVTTLLSVLGTWGAIVLRRKRPREGAQDAVYEINRDTILDLRAQNEALRKENDTLRTSRAEFEGALITANANVRIAQQAAETAARAAGENLAELGLLRNRWVAAQGYIHTLKSTLARHGIAVPPETGHEVAPA